ncbi:hypothetical protein FOL47_010216 [Perkinsus chesapeaki]|uniref:Uncharacterized protein n=1 Tax=Perkinsus chesapeaki TaxID=330153 RepID=A0A7J6L2X4_PERCH|nr:hypothetical protein FOL47_010216 [Perkinsus chesapeaki]
MHQFLDVFLLVITVRAIGESSDINKYISSATITENTRVVDVSLEHNPMISSTLGNSTSWTYPTDCHPTKRSLVEPFCVVGAYTISDTVSISLDLYLYDVNDNTKTVLLGITSRFSNADTINMTGYSYGCADLFDQTLSYGSIRGIVRACMSGGGRGKYDPATKQYTIPSTISTNVTVRGFGHDLLNDNYTLHGQYHSGVDFDMGLSVSVGSHIERRGIYRGNMAFDASLGTVDNDLFAWHAFAGLRASAQLLDFEPAYASYPFVDLIFNVKP